MPISDYRIVRGHDAADLQNKVREALAERWNLLGAPLIDGRALLQAMIFHDDQPVIAALNVAGVQAAEELAAANLSQDNAAQLYEALQAAGQSAATPAPAPEPVPKTAKAASKPTAAKE